MKLPNVKRQYRWAVPASIAHRGLCRGDSLLGASQHFGLDRKTIREWRDRYGAEGIPGLRPRYPAQRPTRMAPATIALLEQARRKLEYGAARTRIWLRRVLLADLRNRPNLDRWATGQWAAGARVDFCFASATRRREMSRRLFNLAERGGPAS